MRAAGSILPLDGGGGGGIGTVTSVNGVAPVLGDVSLAATDIPFSVAYSGTKADSVTDVGGMLDHNHLYVGTAGVWWSEPTLGAVAPLAGSSYTIDTNTIATTPAGGAPINLPATRDMSVSHPGSILALGSAKLTIIGNVDGDLLHGEVIADGLTLFNLSVDPAARDLQMESPSARPLVVTDLTLLGKGGALIEGTLGPTALRGLILAPQAPGARGIEFDGTVEACVVTGSFANAPTGGGYTAYTVRSTCTINELFLFDTNGIVTADATDHMLCIDNSATVPTSPIPTSVVGVSVTNCNILGPGSLLDPAGLGPESIKLVSRSHLNGPASNFIGDAIFNSAGAPPDALLNHVGQAGVPLIVPFTNADNGGVGGTLRILEPTSAIERHSVILGTAHGVSVNVGGTYTGADGDYPATQAATSGSGSGAEFTVTLTAGAISAVVSVDKYGEGYAVADTITLIVVGPAETVAAVLDVAVAAWLLRTDGPVSDLDGPVSWRVDHQRNGGVGSTVSGYLARRAGGVGPWVEVEGSASVPQALNLPTTATGSARLKGIGPEDEWTIFWLNDNGNATITQITIIEPFVEGQ